MATFSAQRVVSMLSDNNAIVAIFALPIPRLAKEHLQTEPTLIINRLIGKKIENREISIVKDVIDEFDGVLDQHNKARTSTILKEEAANGNIVSVKLWASILKGDGRCLAPNDDILFKHLSSEDIDRGSSAAFQRFDFQFYREWQSLKKCSKKPNSDKSSCFEVLEQ